MKENWKMQMCYVLCVRNTMVRSTVPVAVVVLPFLSVARLCSRRYPQPQPTPTPPCAVRHRQDANKKTVHWLSLLFLCARRPNVAFPDFLRTRAVEEQAAGAWQ